MLIHINETKQSRSSFFLFLYFIDARRAALILSHSAQSARPIFRRLVTRHLRHHPYIRHFMEDGSLLVAKSDFIRPRSLQRGADVVGPCRQPDREVGRPGPWDDVVGPWGLTLRDH